MDNPFEGGYKQKNPFEIKNKSGISKMLFFGLPSICAFILVVVGVISLIDASDNSFENSLKDLFSSNSIVDTSNENETDTSSEDETDATNQDVSSNEETNLNIDYSSEEMTDYFYNHSSDFSPESEIGSVFDDIKTPGELFTTEDYLDLDTQMKVGREESIKPGYYNVVYETENQNYNLDNFHMYIDNDNYHYDDLLYGYDVSAYFEDNTVVRVYLKEGDIITFSQDIPTKYTLEPIAIETYNPNFEIYAESGLFFSSGTLTIPTECDLFKVTVYEYNNDEQNYQKHEIEVWNNEIETDKDGKDKSSKLNSYKNGSFYEFNFDGPYLLEIEA